jgi:hypothetical protein
MSFIRLRRGSSGDESANSRVARVFQMFYFRADGPVPMENPCR